eukprot:401919-Pelagomonas_calceolata.AAC.1
MLVLMHRESSLRGRDRVRNGLSLPLLPLRACVCVCVCVCTRAHMPEVLCANKHVCTLHVHACALAKHAGKYYVHPTSFSPPVHPQTPKMSFLLEQNTSKLGTHVRECTSILQASKLGTQRFLINPLSSIFLAASQSLSPLVFSPGQSQTATRCKE